MAREYDSTSSESKVYMGSSLPPGVEEQKGKLMIQLQGVEWQGTASLQSASVHINWWGQAAADNLVLVIPDGSCPPAITAVYPLVSSMKQFSRYLQDMGMLELCLVVSKRDTSAGDPGVSLGNFYLEAANLAEDVQIQGSHAVFDKAGVFLAIVSLKVSLTYSFNGAGAKRTQSDKSTILGKSFSFEDLVAQRLNLLRGKEGREQSPTLPSADLKVEDIGRSLTAQVRSNLADDVAKGYDNSGQRKEIVMDFEVSSRHRASSGDSLDTDRFEILRTKQTVMDVEVRTPPNGIDEFPQRRQLVLDVNVPSTDRGHLLSSKNVEQLSPRKQLVIDIDVPPKDRGHLGFPFDPSTSPRIVILEDEIPAKHPKKLVQEDPGEKTNISSPEGVASSGTPPSTKLEASQSPRIQDLGRSNKSRAKKKKGRVTTPSKSRPLSAPASMKRDHNSSRPASPSSVVTIPRGNQPERNGEATGLNSSRGAGRPRFVGLPQGKEQRGLGIKPVSLAREHANHRPISSSNETSSSRKRQQKSSKDTKEPFVENGTSRIPSPTTQQLGSQSSSKQLISPTKRKAGPVKSARADTPSRSKLGRGRSSTPVKQTPALLTTTEELELNLNEEAKRNCELHSRSLEIIPRVPATIRVSLQRSPPRNSKHGPKAEITTKSTLNCDIHLKPEEHTAAVPEQQLKSRWHELSGNLAILPGDDPCSPNMGESKSEEFFEAESLERLIDRLEAFQQVLQKSSFAAHTVELERNKSLDLSHRLKDVDENISSISRHLTRMLPDHHVAHNDVDYDGEPKYARVVTLRSERLAGDDVTEAKKRELVLQPKKGEGLRQCKDQEQLKHLDNVCEVHHDHPKQPAPMEISFPSEKIQRFNEGPLKKKELNSTPRSSASVHLHDGCNVHGDTHLDGEKSPEMNLRLILTVGKLTFEELALRELGIEHPRQLIENAFGSNVVQLSSCLLTISVPGVLHSTHRGSEQSLSISPVSLGRKDVYFGQKSQLNWSGLRRDTLKLWGSQAIKVTATLNGDFEDSLVCHGSVYLGRVIGSMPECYQTNLELQRVPRLDSKSRSRFVPTMTAEEPAAAAKIEIGITLLMEDMSGKPEMMGAWLYISAYSITGCIPQLKNRGRIGHLHLVVRIDQGDNHHIPFLVDCGDEGAGIKTWKLCKRRHSDAVFRAPKHLDNATLFVEVWQDWRGNILGKAASHYFIGLVEVPLAACKPTPFVETVVPEVHGKGSQKPSKKGLISFYGRVKDNAVVAAEGSFSILNPLQDVVCGSLRLRAVLGSQAQMLLLQKQDRAARIIQSYVRCFAERIRAGKVECVLFAGKHNRFAEEQFPVDYKGGVTRHVLEVTVQHSTDLPTTESFKGAVSARCEGAFIKYLFPCDGEPFYTQDMRWGRSIFFNASVHHGIILPTNESLETHLMKMKTLSKNDGNLLFELWGCFTSDLDKQTYLPNKLRLSDSGEPASWDMRREKSTNSTEKLPEREPKKKLLGTCKLLQKNLLHMISEKRRSLYLSPEARKKFYLPVQIDQSQFQTYTRAATLVVQVAYFILEIEDRKAHMVDTIFSDTHLREDSLLEAILEIDILGASGLESAVREVEQNSKGLSMPIENGVNSYVRYSIFPCNRQLELIYPPAITATKPNDFAPQYRWTGEVKIILNVQVLRELRTGNMRFEVWHHSYSHARTKLRPLVPSEESSATDICLGVATIPSRILLTRKEGVTGWHDLSKKGEVVGAIKLAVRFKNWRVRPL